MVEQVLRVLLKDSPERLSAAVVVAMLDDGAPRTPITAVDVEPVSLKGAVHAAGRPSTPAGARQRFRGILSRPTGSFGRSGIMLLGVGHAFSPLEHFLYKMFPMHCPTKFRAGGNLLGYCISDRWLTTNPAKELKGAGNLKPNEVVPYTHDEERRILAACDQIGGAKYKRIDAVYERRRARAMVLSFRHTALRISDVCTLRRDALSWDVEKTTWRLFVRTQKSGEPVFLQIPETMKLALDALPLPRKAATDCPYFFWNGNTVKRAVVGIEERAIAAVFKKSGVKDAHAHRYRHTLATRLLEQGASYEQVADILGTARLWSESITGSGRRAVRTADRLMMDHLRTVPVTVPSHVSHTKIRSL